MTRAQAHTLEAVAAGLLLISGVAFALQVTAVTPLTGSASSQHVEHQQAEVARGLLAAEAENGSLRPTLLYWNDSSGRFHGALDDGDGYANAGPPTAFGDALNRTFGDDSGRTLRDPGVAFNVNAYPLDGDGRRAAEPTEIVHMGEPSDHAVAARRTVTLTDRDRLRDAAGAPTATTLAEAESYFAPDVAPDRGLYNVVEIEVVAWRM